MDFLTSIESAEWFGIVSAFVIFFGAVAKVTPTKTDDKILAIIYKISSVFGLNFKDNEGKK